MLYCHYKVKQRQLQSVTSTPQPAQVDVAPTQRLKPHRLEAVYPVLPRLARYGCYKTSSVCARALDLRTLIVVWSSV
nr:MAG TPA: hypothetical protein [Caudoviricetes sp.]